MIITLEEVKTALGITDTSQDEELVSLILSVQEQIFTYCNNWFVDTRFNFSSTSLVFSPSVPTPTTNAKIEDANNDFVAKGFYDGMEIIVRCAERNYGNKTVRSVTANRLILGNNEDIIAESSSTQIYLLKMMVPYSLKNLALKMVKMNYGEGGGIYTDIKSESVGNYSVSYGGGSGGSSGSGGGSLYPSGIQAQLNMFRKAKFIGAYSHTGLCRDYSALRFQL